METTVINNKDKYLGKTGIFDNINEYIGKLTYNESSIGIFNHLTDLNPLKNDYIIKFISFPNGIKVKCVVRKKYSLGFFPTPLFSEKKDIKYNILFEKIESINITVNNEEYNDKIPLLELFPFFSKLYWNKIFKKIEETLKSNKKNTIKKKESLTKDNFTITFGLKDKEYNKDSENTPPNQQNQIQSTENKNELSFKFKREQLFELLEFVKKLNYNQLSINIDEKIIYNHNYLSKDNTYTIYSKKLFLKKYLDNIKSTLGDNLTDELKGIIKNNKNGEFTDKSITIGVKLHKKPLYFAFLNYIFSTSYLNKNIHHISIKVDTKKKPQPDFDYCIKINNISMLFSFFYELMEKKMKRIITTSEKKQTKQTKQTKQMKKHKRSKKRKK